jgi:hypothetical protein
VNPDQYSVPKRENVARVYSPVDFSVEKCLPPHLRKYEDDARYVIGQIRWQQLMRFPREIRKADNPGVELKARYLRSILRCKDRYSDLIEALVSSGAITCDRYYVEGRKCRSYNLGDLFSREFKRYDLTDKFLLKNITRWRSREVADLTPLHAWLRSKLFLLGIRDGDAIQAIADDEDSNLFIPQIEAIRDKAPVRYHQDPYGRVHTNLTNLPKRLRQFLVVDGSSLCEIDVPNSQPLFFGVSLHAPNYKLSSSSVESSLSPEIAKLLDQLIPNTPPPTTTPLRSRFSIGKYIEDVCRGRFYEVIAETAGMTREDVKAHVLRYLYCDDVLWGKKGKVLRTQYPETARVFDAIEELYPEIVPHLKAGKEGDYRRLSHNMQRAESYYMFQMVCQRVWRERPETFLATIHDSLLVKPEDVDYAYGVMMGEMRSLGMNVKEMKVKRH